MEFFDSETTAVIQDGAHRSSVMSQLEVLVQQGIDADIAKRELRRSTASYHHAEKIAKVIDRLQNEALGDTLENLSHYSTETLEYVLSEVRTINLSTDYLHEVVGPIANWRKSTGDHWEQMFRDTIHLRHTSLKPNPWHSYAMFETYAALGITPGGIHLLTDERERTVARAILLAARESQSVMYTVEATKLRKRKDIEDVRERTQLSRENFRESRVSAHLTPEIVQYLTEYPEYVDEFTQYMKERGEHLPVVHLDHFHALTTAPAALRTGTL